MLLAPVALLAQKGSEEPLARLDNAMFMKPGGLVYTEVYIRIPGQSLTYRPVDSQHYRAKALISLTVSKAGQSHYEKQYLLRSPKVKDTNQVAFVLTDQRKVPLEREGRHTLAFRVVDSFNQSNRATVQKPLFNRVASTNSPVFSDIKVLDTVLPTTEEGRFVEGSYLMRPLASTRIPPEDENAYFYTELYNADRLSAVGDAIDVHVMLLHQQDTLYQKKQVFDAKPVIKILARLQRDKLKPGKNRIIVTTPTEEGKNLSTGIQVTSPYAAPSDTISLRGHLADYSTDSLLTFLKWMRTVSGNKEAKQLALLEKKPRRDSILGFMTGFWEKRNPVDPKEAWLSYRKDVRYVNQTYSNPLYKGYESDRGRVYLQYGKPNTIQRSPDDPNTYPYEIWHYFRTEKQANVRFVFYSNSILGAEFVLLHSDAVGEIRDPQWKEKLDRSALDREDPFGNDPGWDFQK